MADGKIIIETDLDSSGIKTGLSKLSNIAKTGLKTTVTAITAAGTALAGLGGAAIKVGADFEAGMSEVQAIARASAEDMELLKEKAKEMGAKTKYSASESAEAFKYMAMAGWGTQDMLDGISGVMSLAAASGEELGLVSDIVTDSLTAFGLSAKEAAHFSDVLAIAATSTNTDVSKMGYTFKYVAPVAGALGFSVEDTAVAIGLMANSGIKAEMAGTNLRAMLTNLSKPTKEVQGYMDKLNVSLTDSQGQVKPLNQLMGEMRESFKNLTDAQKAEYAAGIAGKEAMSGLLAIVKASDEDFAKLTEQINNCNGASEQAAKVMNDNLKGSVRLLKSALESLGIEFYESVDAPMKDIVNTATGMVDNLNKAFKNGGLSGLVSELGTVFADVVTMAANSAPKMIEAAINMIQSFLSGIQNNSNQIGEAAVKIGKALLNGLVTTAPQIAQVGFNLMAAFVGGIFGSGVGEQVASIGKSIADTFRSMLKAVGSAIQALKPVITNVATVITGTVNAALKVFSGIVTFLANNIKAFIPLISAAAAAFGTWKAVQTVSKSMEKANKAIEAFNALNTIFAKRLMVSTGAITAKQIAVGVLTGKIKLATAAKAAFSAIKLTNPWLAIGAAVAGAAAGIVGLVSCLSSEKKKHKELMESIEKEKKAREDLHTEQQKKLKTDLTEINRTEELNRELKHLVDANGKVKKGYEARANYIMTELNKACGTEMELINGVIIGYGKLTDQYHAVLDQSKAWNDELKNLVDSTGKIKQGEEARAKVLTENLNQAMGANYEITNGTIQNYEQLSASIDTQIGQNRALADELNTLLDQNGKVKAGYEERAEFILGELSKATGIEIGSLEELQKAHQGLQDEIDKTIEKKKAAIIVESYEDVYKNALEKQTQSLIDLGELQKEYDAAKKEHDDYKSSRPDNIDGRADRYLGQLKSKMDEAETRLKNHVEVVDGYFLDIADIENLHVMLESGNQEDIAKILARGAATYDETGKLIVRTVEENLELERAKRAEYAKLQNQATTEEKRKEYETQIKTCDANIKVLENEMAAKTAVVSSGMQNLLTQQITLIDSHGEQFQVSFEELMAKGQEGLKNGEAGVSLAMSENMDAILKAIMDSELPIEEQTKALADVQAKIFNNNIPVVEAKEQAAMQAVLSAIQSTNPNMAASVSALLNAGILQMENGKLEFTEKAKQLGLDGAQAIKDTKDEYEEAAKGITEGAGSGVTKNSSLFLNPVTTLASFAAQAFQKALEINSPSKVFANIAKSIPEGIAVGIKNNEDEAIHAVDNLTQDVIDKANSNFNSLDLLGGISQQGTNAAELMEKIKSIDVTAIMDKARAAVYASQAETSQAFAARAGVTNHQTTNYVTKQPVINFNQPVESPDTTARAVNRILTYGLAGDY